MKIRVLFFGQLKDIVGRAEDTVDWTGGARLADVFEHYASRHPRMKELAGSIVFACNQQFCSGATPVAAGDEVAFLPPVSGGSHAGTLPGSRRQALAGSAIVSSHGSPSSISR